MKRCAICGTTYDGSEKFCRQDGAPLQADQANSVAPPAVAESVSGAAALVPVSAAVSAPESAPVSVPTSGSVPVPKPGAVAAPKPGAVAAPSPGAVAGLSSSSVPGTGSIAALGLAGVGAKSALASNATGHTSRVSTDETATVVGPIPIDPDETPPLFGRVNQEDGATPPMTAMPQVSAKLAALQGKTQPPPLPAKTTRKQALPPDLFVPPRSSPSGRSMPIPVVPDPSFNTTQITALSDEDPEIRNNYSGKTIDGRYLIGKLIGHGGMGAVFECEQVHLRKRMAIKLLHENLVQKKALIARFQREARAISRLSSPHTVMVYDFGRWGELFFLVMELLEGEPLDAMLEHAGPLPAERVARIVLQMCDSLAEAHKNGIVHRDLKPENVILVRNQAHPDFVKILDFGLAKVQGINDEDQVHSQRDIFGTPFYMSPEQIRAAAVDGRSDIYAVGALMYKMLTGKPVFAHKNTFDILKAHLMDAPAKMATVVPNNLVPPAMERIVLKALQKDPSMRFASMDEMALALAQTLRSGFRESGMVLAAGTLDIDTVVPSSTSPGAKTTRGERAPRNKAIRQTNLSNIAKLSDIFDPDELLQTTRAVERSRLRLFVGGIVALLLAVAGLWWWTSFSPAEVEQEPNDDLAHANRLGPNDQVRGVIGKRKSDRLGDRDCFVLPTGTDGQDVEISVAGVPNVDLQVVLYPDGSTKPIAVNHRGRGQGELVRFWDPLQRPTLACVEEANQAGQTPSESLSDQYTLAVTKNALPQNVEREPNDAAPGNETKVGATLTAVLDGLADRDVFAVPASCEGRLLRAQLQVVGAPTAAGARLELYDGSGHLIVTHTAKAGQLHSELAFVGTAQQLPDHVVVARQPAKMGEVVTDDLPYTLTFVVQDVVDQAEIEPNDAQDSAQHLVLGAWHTGDTGDGAQTDWLHIGGGDPGSRSARIEVAAVKGALNLLIRDVGSKADLRSVAVTDAQVKEIVINNATGQGLLLRVTALDVAGRKRQAAGWRLRVRTYASGATP